MPLRGSPGLQGGLSLPLRLFIEGGPLAPGGLSHVKVVEVAGAGGDGLGLVSAECLPQRSFERLNRPHCLGCYVIQRQKGAPKFG